MKSFFNLNYMVHNGGDDGLKVYNFISPVELLS